MSNTEPAVSLLKHPIEVNSLTSAVSVASAVLSQAAPGGSLVLAAVDDDGRVGGRVSLTFKKVRENGDEFGVGAFAEYNLTGERKAGGVITWSFGRARWGG